MANELLTLNISEHTEKKNGLTYLSWAWAWSTLLKLDPLATWEAVEFNGVPAAFLPDGSAMVKTIVTFKGHAKSCWLPVMNNRNQAIKNPDSFAINTAIVRCLTKTISMHGLGLYIYAGEDLPPLDTEELDRLVAELVQLQEENNMVQACKNWYEHPMIATSNEAREYAWNQLRAYSAIRSAIKANNPHSKAAKPQKEAA